MPPTTTPVASAAPPDYHHRHHQNPHLLPIILLTSLAITFLTSLLVLISLLLHKKLSRNRAIRTTPSDNTHHAASSRRFSYSTLRRHTSSFSPSSLLGHGGFGSVYKAALPSGLSLAVKVMDSPGSLQGEREFHNELSICSSLNHPNILSLLGHSSDKRRRRLVLVYEFMPNRSLQDALFDKKCSELMVWGRRFDIVVNVALGLQYLHHCCVPAVIHGDIKPSNVLLDGEFKAKIGDFGLARLKTEDDGIVEEQSGDIECGKVKKDAGEDNGSILGETESVLTNGVEENGVFNPLPESCVRIIDSEASPETVVAGTEKASVSEGCFDKISVDSTGKDLIGKKKGGSGRDWWWKQDNNGGNGSENGKVKDYVMEWIGNEINKERPRSEWVASLSTNASPSSNSKQKKQGKRLDWWVSLDDEGTKKKEKNQKKPREWWKEEFCEELTKKKKKRETKSSNRGASKPWWEGDEEMGKAKMKRKSKNSKSSIDSLLNGLSGELKLRRRNSQDWTANDIPKSGNISSTPSMRGTVCYIAPEYGCGRQISEKCDIYSFGVLLLVLISGRRPLQVMVSPRSEFERANLISWTKQLARNGKLLDLVDPSVHSLDKEEALLCITIALLCLQRSPVKRPTTNDIVAMLLGETDPPHLPFEFSPSPPSDFLFESPRKTP